MRAPDTTCYLPGSARRAHTPRSDRAQGLRRLFAASQPGAPLLRLIGKQVRLQDDQRDDQHDDGHADGDDATALPTWPGHGATRAPVALPILN